jgi:hypothetical protein
VMLHSRIMKREGAVDCSKFERIPSRGQFDPKNRYPHDGHRKRKVARAVDGNTGLSPEIIGTVTPEATLPIR